MYIIELIYKLLNKKDKERKLPQQEKEYEKCEHVFLPLDSTNEVLACTKCGIIIHRKDLDKSTNNPFQR